MTSPLEEVYAQGCPVCNPLPGQPCQTTPARTAHADMMAYHQELVAESNAQPVYSRGGDRRPPETLE